MRQFTPATDIEKYVATLLLLICVSISATNYNSTLLFKQGEMRGCLTTVI